MSSCRAENPGSGHSASSLPTHLISVEGYRDGEKVRGVSSPARKFYSRKECQGPIQIGE